MYHHELMILPRRNLARPADPVEIPTHLHAKPAELKVSLIPTTLPEVKKGYDPVAMAIIMDIAKAEGRAEAEALANAEALAELEAHEAELREDELAREQRRAEEEAREAEAHVDELDVQSALEPGESLQVGPHRSLSPGRESGKCRNRKSRSPRSSKSPPKAAAPFIEHHGRKQRPDPKKYAAVELQLSTYLNEYCKESMEKILEAKSLDVAIDFNILMSRNKDLAYHICNEWKDDKMQTTLRKIARDYLRKLFKENDHLSEKFAADNMIQGDIQEQVEIRISGACFYLLGMPNSVQNLKEFTEQNKSVQRKLFRRHKRFECEVPEMNPRGRRVLQKVVDKVLAAHREGKHGNGEWRLEDWDVNDGGASVTTTKLFYTMEGKSWNEKCCSIHLDLECIASQILPAFALSETKDRSVDGSAETSSKAAQGQSADPVKVKDPVDTSHLYPPFLFHFKSELANPMELSQQDHFGWYCEYLGFHPALLSSKARMILVFGFYHVAVHLGYKNKKAYGDVLGNQDSFPDWTKMWYFPRVQGLKVHEFLWKVFWYRNYPDESLPTWQWPLQYYDTACDLLELVRHLLEHVFLHSKEFLMSLLENEKGNVEGDKRKFAMRYVQTITSDDEADLFVSIHFPTFLPRFIKLFFVNGKMEGEFADYWKLYKAARDV